MHDFGAAEGEISGFVNLLEDLDPHLTAALVASLSPSSQALIAKWRARFDRTRTYRARWARQDQLRDQAKAKLTAEEIAALRL